MPKGTAAAEEARRIERRASPFVELAHFVQGRVKPRVIMCVAKMQSQEGRTVPREQLGKSWFLQLSDTYWSLEMAMMMNLMMVTTGGLAA